MKVLRQLALSLAVVAAGVYIWVAYVPAAQPMLDRIGLLDLLGIEASQAPDADSQDDWSDDGPARVITATVGQQALADRVSAIGDGRALRSVSVRSNAVGTITDMALAAGSSLRTRTAR